MINEKLYLRTTEGKTIGYIYVIFYINGQKVNFTSKVECMEKDWNDKDMKIRSSDKSHKDKNLILSNIRARISNVAVKFRLQEKTLTKDLFWKHYNKPDDYRTFHDFCTYWKKETYNLLSPNTTRMHDSVLSKLKNYAPVLHFEDFSKEWLQRYENYLKRDQGNNENTVGKNMTVLKKYIHAAQRAGYIDSDPFAMYKIKSEKTDIVFLEEEELTKLWKLNENFDMEDKYRATLRLFLFMCLGSQHVGDAKLMRIEQFTNISFSYYRMKIKNVKPLLVTVPLSKPMRMLLNEMIGTKKKGRIFENLPADQTMNEYLKDIADHAGIKKQITHKTGRHTFATIFLENNPNIKTLQDILGHSDAKTTMIYVHALKKAKQRGITCFDKILK
jgi:site-specific recombinase XerD